MTKTIPYFRQKHIAGGLLCPFVYVLFALYHFTI